MKAERCFGGGSIGCANGVGIPEPLDFFVVLAGATYHSGLVSDPRAMCANPGHDGPPHLHWQHFRGKDSGQIPREKLDEKRGYVRGRVSHRRGEEALLPDLVQGRKHAVGSSQQMLVFFFAALDAADQHHGGKTGVLQNT